MCNHNYVDSQHKIWEGCEVQLEEEMVQRDQCRKLMEHANIVVTYFGTLSIARYDVMGWAGIGLHGAVNSS